MSINIIPPLYKPKRPSWASPSDFIDIILNTDLFSDIADKIKVIDPYKTIVIDSFKNSTLLYGDVDDTTICVNKIDFNKCGIFGTYENRSAIAILPFDDYSSTSGDILAFMIKFNKSKGCTKLTSYISICDNKIMIGDKTLYEIEYGKWYIIMIVVKSKACIITDSLDINCIDNDSIDFVVNNPEISYASCYGNSDYHSACIDWVIATTSYHPIG